MRISSTPTGDRAKAIIRKIDRWCLKQEDESTLDWEYQDQVKVLEHLYESMCALTAEQKERDREEAKERRAWEREQRKGTVKNESHS